jgi:Ca2+-binding RTX toxin-like protein
MSSAPEFIALESPTGEIFHIVLTDVAHHQGAFTYEIVPGSASTAVTVTEAEFNLALTLLHDSFHDLGLPFDDIDIHSVHGTGGDDALVFANGPSGVFGDSGDDLIDTTADRYRSQIHTFGGPGSDWTIMRFDGITAASLQQIGHAHGHHVRGDADPQRVRGSDVFEFRDIGSVSGIVVGRIEDFDSSRDRLLIEGQDIGLSDGFASCVIDGNHIRIVRYNGDHNDPSADPQQWLLIETASGGTIFYTLEGARANMSPDANYSRDQEPHFLNQLPDFDRLETVTYVDPVNYVPDGYGAEPGGIMLNDDDNIAAHVDRVIYGSDYGDAISAGLNNDVVEALGGDDFIWGGSGHDTIHAGSGDDQVWGNAGDDVIWAGSGDDVIHTGLGNDQVWAGEGDDIIFVWQTSRRDHAPAEARCATGERATTVAADGAGQDAAEHATMLADAPDTCGAALASGDFALGDGALFLDGV